MWGVCVFVSDERGHRWERRHRCLPLVIVLSHERCVSRVVQQYTVPYRVPCIEYPCFCELACVQYCVYPSSLASCDELYTEVFEVEPELIFTPRCIRRHRRADLSIEVHVAVAAPERRPRPRPPTSPRATRRQTGVLYSFSSPQGVCGAANEQDTVLGWHDETNGRWPDYIAHEATHAQLRDLSFHTRWVVLPGFQLLQCRSILGRVHSCPSRTCSNPVLRALCDVWTTLHPGSKSHLTHRTQVGHSCWHAHVCLPRCIFSGSTLLHRKAGARAPLW